MGRIRRWLGVLHYRILFAVPVADMFSPLRMHRREKLQAIPLQSASRLLDVEILAKATFLVQTIEEVAVPDLPSPEIGSLGPDLRALFSHPRFQRGEDESGPAEPTQGQGEGADSPGTQNGQGNQDVAVEQGRPLEHDLAQGVQELGQRQGLYEGLDHVGEASEEKKSPLKTHIGSMTAFISPLTVSVV